MRAILLAAILSSPALAGQGRGYIPNSSASASTAAVTYTPQTNVNLPYGINATSGTFSTVSTYGTGNATYTVTSSSGLLVQAGTLLSAGPIQATASGNTAYSAYLSSGISVGQGVVANFFSGNGAGLTTVGAPNLVGAVPSVSVGLSTVATTGSCISPQFVQGISNTAITCATPNPSSGGGWTESGSPLRTVTTDIVGMGVTPLDGAASVVMQSTAATSNKLLSFRNSAGTEFGFINNVGDTNGYSTMSVLLRGEGVNSANSGHTMLDLQFANLQSGSLGVINTALRLETGGSGSTSNNISGDASKNFWFRVDNQNHSGGSGAYTEFLNVNAMGNVGIGTARAVSALHISSSPFRFCNGGTCYNDTNMSLLVDGDAATSFQIGTSSLVITSTGATFGIPIVTQSSVTLANGALWIGQSPVTVTGSSVTLSATTPLLASSATFAGVFLSSAPTGAAGALVTATCPANTYVLSGGCNCSGGTGLAALINAPGFTAPGGATGTTWQCQATGTVGATCTPYVICSRLQ